MHSHKENDMQQASPGTVNPLATDVMGVSATLLHANEEMKSHTDEQLVFRLIHAVRRLQCVANQTHSVAAAGQAYADRTEEAVIRSLFELVEELHADAQSVHELLAGLVFLAQRLQVKTLPRAA